MSADPVLIAILVMLAILAAPLTADWRRRLATAASTPSTNGTCCAARGWPRLPSGAPSSGWPRATAPPAPGTPGSPGCPGGAA